MVKESDVYLGVTVSDRGVRQSIDATLNNRFKKAKDKAYQLRAMCRHPTFQDIGWLKSVVTFFQACVSPTLLYSAETWYYASEKFGDVIEAKYRALLIIMLGIPKTTNYLSLLHEIDVMQARHVIAARRIKYLNKMMNGHSNNHTRELVIHEYNIAPEDKKHETFVGHVSKLCMVYGIPDVAKSNDVDDNTIADAVREMNNKECWAVSMTGRLTVPRIFLRNSETCYQTWSWTESVAILKYRVGLLKLRGQLKYLASDGDTRCRNEGCVEVETTAHIMVCPAVWTQKPQNSTPRELARYLVDLNRERMSRFRSPIL